MMSLVWAAIRYEVVGLVGLMFALVRSGHVGEHYR